MNNNIKIGLKVIIIFVIIMNIPISHIYSEKIESAVSSLTGTMTAHNGKSIYIYNTHQKEEYQNKSVKEGSKYLMNLLKEKGYGVTYETNDFEVYRVKNNMKYNQAYAVSQKYILKELSNNDDYDLIIDFHRDSISRNLSVLTHDNKDYAKVMFVVGKGSPNYEEVKKESKTLSDMINYKIPKLSRGIYVKTNHYNQGLADHMVLIEVGASTNTYEEVTNTLNILALVIDEYLSR